MDKERIDELGINNKKIIQNTDYFCFGMDSILLANFVESRTTSKIVDFCSGTGVIPIVISQRKNYKEIYAIELQDEMYDLLERNIKLNELENIIIPIKEDINNIIKLKLGKVDIVTVNPPYKSIGTGTQNENKVKYIARHEEYCTLENVFESASKILKEKGKLYLVHKPDRLGDLIDYGRKYNLELKKMRLVYPRINEVPSIILLEYVYFGGKELKILPPLIEYDENNEYVQEIKDMYYGKEN